MLNNILILMIYLFLNYHLFELKNPMFLNILHLMNIEQFFFLSYLICLLLNHKYLKCNLNKMSSNNLHVYVYLHLYKMKLNLGCILFLFQQHLMKTIFLLILMIQYQFDIYNYVLYIYLLYIFLYQILFHNTKKNYL